VGLRRTARDVEGQKGKLKKTKGKLKKTVAEEEGINHSPPPI
jgi:hypothetical protein